LKKLPRVITSFNAEGYKVYGKRFVETWLEFWPKTVALTVFYEGEDTDFEMLPGISWHPIEDVEFLTDYLNALKPFPLFSGIVGDRYDINFDARMGRKTFMQVHACRKYGGKVFWMDADSVTVKHVPERFLDDCLPDDKFNCYLGRDGWYYTESGFIGFNSDHPIAKRFLRDYVHVFIVGSIFTQIGWHDCIAFDAIRFMAAKDGYAGEFVNLSAHVPKGTMHPHANSVIGQYVQHLKGDRKNTGELKEGDIVT
jgi:hypothetical protein